MVLPYINMNPPWCTRVPHPKTPSHIPPCTIPLGHPSAPAPSILYPASCQSSNKAIFLSVCVCVCVCVCVLLSHWGNVNLKHPSQSSYCLTSEIISLHLILRFLLCLFLWLFLFFFVLDSLVSHSIPFSKLLVKNTPSNIVPNTY